MLCSKLHCQIFLKRDSFPLESDQSTGVDFHAAPPLSCSSQSR